MGKLKEKSIKKIKNSNIKSRKKSFENHKRKLQEKRNIEYVKRREYRNFRVNKLAVNKSESRLHNYAKFCCCQTLSESNIEFMTEYPLSNGKIADIITFDRGGFIIEVEREGQQKKRQEVKLDNYDYLLQSGFINDIFIIPLSIFEDGLLDLNIGKVKERLGL